MRWTLFSKQAMYHCTTRLPGILPARTGATTGGSASASATFRPACTIFGPTRLSATLARGADRFDHFDHEARPQAELDEAALAVHADSQSRYWKAASGIAEMRHIH